MKLYRRALALSALVTAWVMIPATAQAQRGDSFSWKLGVQGGSFIVQTRTQDSEVLPSAGAHFLIMSRRGGLMVGVDEGFGSDQRSGVVLFNDIRRYQAMLMAFPVALPLEPYFGVGGGVIQVVSPRIDPAITDPFEQATLLDAAKEASASAYASFLAGVQGRWGRLTVFGQYQIHSSPDSDKLLRGAMHSIHGGVRVALGSSREGIRSGGY